MYAHMISGSVTVALGDTVKEGDVLGHLGNTGNANASHLHFQLMDGPSLLESDSLPYELKGFDYDGQVAPAADRRRGRLPERHLPAGQAAQAAVADARAAAQPRDHRLQVVPPRLSRRPGALATRRSRASARRRRSSSPGRVRRPIRRRRRSRRPRARACRPSPGGSAWPITPSQPGSQAADVEMPASGLPRNIITIAPMVKPLPPKSSFRPASGRARAAIPSAMAPATGQKTAVRDAAEEECQHRGDDGAADGREADDAADGPAEATGEDGAEGDGRHDAAEDEREGESADARPRTGSAAGRGTTSVCAASRPSCAASASPVAPMVEEIATDPALATSVCTALSPPRIRPPLPASRMAVVRSSGDS